MSREMSVGGRLEEREGGSLEGGSPAVEFLRRASRRTRRSNFHLFVVLKWTIITALDAAATGHHAALSFCFIHQAIGISL